MERVKVVLTEEELNVAAKTYQKRLRLEDWAVMVQLIPQRLIGDGACAAVKFNLTHKDALVCIATPETYVGSVEEPQNMLSDLYHELIHLLFPTIHAEGTDLELFEHGVDVLAHALFSSQPLGGADDDNYNTEKDDYA